MRMLSRWFAIIRRAGRGADAHRPHTAHGIPIDTRPPRADPSETVPHHRTIGQARRALRNEERGTRDQATYVSLGPPNNPRFKTFEREAAHPTRAMPMYQPPRWQAPRKHGLQLPLSRDQLGAMICYPVLATVRTNAAYVSYVRSCRCACVPRVQMTPQLRSNVRDPHHTHVHTHRRST